MRLCATRWLRNRHVVHLHRQRHRGVIAEQHQHLGDAVAAQHVLDLGELRVRKLGAGHERRGEAVHGAFVRVGERGLAAGEDRVDRLLRETGGLAFADMRLPDVIALPMLRDHQDYDLDLALRQRRALVEEGPDPLHAARHRRAVDPDLVWAEDAAAAGGELIEDRGLLGGELFPRDFENAVHAMHVLGGIVGLIAGEGNAGRVGVRKTGSAGAARRDSRAASCLRTRAGTGRGAAAPAPRARRNRRARRAGRET
jgi:hypothetical protein